MSIELCVLASGSSGNCSVVRTPGGVMLLDAGIGPRLVAKRLDGTGVSVGDISAICITHLDRDHFSPSWIPYALRHGIPIHCHESCIASLLRIAGEQPLGEMLRPFDNDGSFELLPDITARPIPLAHDRAGSHGFVVSGFGYRLGFATDLGYVPSRLIEHFVDLDVVALESNYDPQMQNESARPFYLKRRITGGRGHLSNEQAFQAIRKILDIAQRRRAGLPNHVVLLHRSQQCNCPKLVQRLFRSDARIAPRLVLAEQYSRTEWLSAAGRRTLTGEQLLLAW
jgi:phosphoribosyl 1,2-cyclic phosphodiesterase